MRPTQLTGNTFRVPDQKQDVDWPEASHGHVLADKYLGQQVDDLHVSG
jgi:hypothetical protein